MMNGFSPQKARAQSGFPARRRPAEVSCRHCRYAESRRLLFPVRGFPALASFLLLSGAVRSQEATAIISGPTQAVTAGSSIPVWIHFLNPSAGAISRALPAKLDARITAGGQVIPAALEARAPGDAGEEAIPAGGFVRREYTLTVPESIEGQAVLDVPMLGASRVVLDVRKPQAAASGTAEEEPSSFFERFVKDVKAHKKDYDPIDFFKNHFFGYEPFYFIAGPDRPTTKFQLSLRYQILNRGGLLAEKVPALTGLNFAYTQVSLWDVGSESSPFLDTSYKPEFLYLWERVDRGRWADWFRLDLQGGLQHESNGNPEINSELLDIGERTSYYVLSGSNGEPVKTSRSLNILYLRPTAVFGKTNRLQVTLIPRIWTYIGDLSDNPDISEYRGYADLRMIVGWNRGLQLSTSGRLGCEGDHGSLQFDLTYPLMRLFSGSLSMYLHAQYFTGYGESLLLYDRRSDAFRIGIALYR